MEVVYHYTSSKNLKAIEKSEFIQESSVDVADDAAFGTGVYLTALSPDAGRKAIAENNYGPYLARHREELGMVECCIKLWIPTSKLTRAKTDRDVWIHRGNVYLNHYHHEIVRWENNGLFCAIL